mgnify:CR=1 FL=1
MIDIRYQNTSTGSVYRLLSQHIERKKENYNNTNNNKIFKTLFIYTF